MGRARHKAVAELFSVIRVEAVIRSTWHLRRKLDDGLHKLEGINL